MTPRQIIDLWRLRYGDAGRWSDDELMGYVAEAQMTAARRDAFITDQSSEACICPVFAGDPLVERHPAVLRVKSARLRSSRVGLEFTTPEKMDVEDPHWRKVVAGPTRLIVRWDDDHMRLFGIPPQDDLALLVVYRLPIEEVALDAELEIKRQWHQHLTQWVTYRALSKPGPGYDGARAIEAKALFEDAFGVEKIDG